MEKFTKTFLTLGLASALLLSTNGVASASKVHYKDVKPTDNFYKSVEYLLEEDAISDTLPRFRPYEKITRGQFSSIYARVMDYKMTFVKESDYHHFKDVPKSHQFYPYVQMMSVFNIMSGYGTWSDTFGVNDNLTRGQLAGILMKRGSFITAESYKENGGKVSDIFDGERFIGQWGQAIATLETIGVMSGYPDGKFKPNNPINRSQFANMIYQMLEGNEVVSERIHTDNSLEKLGISEEVILEKVKSLKDHDVMNYVNSYRHYWYSADVDGTTNYLVLDIRKEGEILFEDINVCI